MMDWESISTPVIVSGLILALDFTVLYNIYKRKDSKRYMVLYSVIILLFPIIGVSIYYLIDWIRKR